MFKRLERVLALTWAIQGFSLGIGSQSEARDLTDVLARGFIFAAPSGEFDLTRGQIASIADFSRVGKTVGPTFSAAIAQAVTQEFPLASEAPAFIYRFNPAVDVFERLTGVPGPLFSERALTLGKGQLDFGVGYSFIDYSHLNGTSLHDIKSPGLIAEFFEGEEKVVDHLSTGEDLVSLPLTISRIRTRIDLNAQLIIPTLRYGITDRWDISLALPVLSTYLRVRHEVVRTGDLATFAAVGPEGLRFADRAGNTLESNLLRFSKSERPTALLSKAAGSATGVGDLMLRTKYQVWQNGFGGAALGLNLQLPTGRAEDFHGTEQTHVFTFLYLSQVLREQFEPHLNIGVDFNADDVSRSSFLYAVGGVLRLGKQLGIVVDFLGRSEFGKFPVHIRPEDRITGVALDRKLDTCTVTEPCFVKNDVSFPAFPVKIQRNDIANFSFGLRYALGSRGSVFFGGIIPLNDDGLRADFIPSGGIEYSF